MVLALNNHDEALGEVKRGHSDIALNRRCVNPTGELRTSTRESGFLISTTNIGEMSRIPQTRSPSKPSARAPTTPLRNKSSSSALAPPSIRVRTTSTPRATAATPARVKSTYEDAPPVPSSTPALSIKEAIALRRAEAKKAQAKSPISGGGLDSLESLQDAIPDALKPTEEEDILGRLSIRDTIERARSTGEICFFLLKSKFSETMI